MSGYEVKKEPMRFIEFNDAMSGEPQKIPVEKIQEEIKDAFEKLFCEFPERKLWVFGFGSRVDICDSLKHVNKMKCGYLRDVIKKVAHGEDRRIFYYCGIFLEFLDMHYRRVYGGYEVQVILHAIQHSTIEGVYYKFKKVLYDYLENHVFVERKDEMLYYDLCTFRKNYDVFKVLFDRKSPLRIEFVTHSKDYNFKNELVDSYDLWNDSFRGGLDEVRDSMKEITSSSSARELKKDMAGTFKTLKTDKLCNVTFKVDGENFPAHREIFAARSLVFRTMFEIPMKESKENVVELNKFDKCTFESFIEYIYTDDLPDETIARCGSQLIELAETYQVKSLEKFLKNTTVKFFTVENISYLLFYNDQTLKKHWDYLFAAKCKRFALYKIDELKDRADFNALPQKILNKFDLNPTKRTKSE